MVLPLRLRYYAYRVSTSMGFYVPVSVVYLLDSGFGVGFVALAQATFSFALLLAEVPTGYLGDRLGRRWTLALGSACRTVGLAGYVVAEAPETFLALKVCFGAGWALRSGTTDAWLYELLGTRGAEDAFARVEGRGSSALLATSAATAVAGGLLYGVDPRLPFAANTVLAVTGVPVVLSAPAVGAETADGDPFTPGDAVRALRAQAGRPEVRWLVVYSVLLFTVFDLTRTFEQPALEAAGVPVAGFGLLYAGFKLTSAGVASAVGAVEDRLGTRRALALLAPLLAVAYAGLWLLPAAIVPVGFVYRSLRVVARPLRNGYLNDRLADVGRATVLSGASMVLSLVGGVARLLGGPVAAETGPVDFLALAGVGLAAAAGAVWLATSPVRPATTADDGGATAAAGTD